MVAVDCKGNGQGQQPGLAEYRPKQQVPVQKTFFAQNAEPDAGAHQREKALPVQRQGKFGNADLF